MAESLLKTQRLPTAWPVLLLLCAAVAAAQNGQAQSSAAQSNQAPAQSSQTIPNQTGTPLPLKPDAPGLHRNHRLILKDGSYQLVREYQVVGDRVKYLSQERSDWEELPANLVDWDATRKWEAAHTESADDSSPGMKDAEDIDKEENSVRAEETARTPTVAPGLDLPDQDGVFVLDTFHGTPELVQLPSTDMSINMRSKHGLGVLNPMAGQTADMEIEGRHSRIHLHVNDPAIYLSLASPDDNQEVLGHAIVVKTTGAKAANVTPGASSAHSAFAIVKVDERNAVRIVGAVHVNRDGSVVQNEDVVAAKGDTLPGKHWLRITPDQSLAIGEYALVEILSTSEISPTVWDFRVDPTKGDNTGSLTPITTPTPVDDTTPTPAAPADDPQ